MQFRLMLRVEQRDNTAPRRGSGERTYMPLVSLSASAASPLDAMETAIRLLTSERDATMEAMRLASVMSYGSAKIEEDEDEEDVSSL